MASLSKQIPNRNIPPDKIGVGQFASIRKEKCQGSNIMAR